jgi:hypothetical protein
MKKIVTLPSPCRSSREPASPSACCNLLLGAILQLSKRGRPKHHRPVFSAHARWPSVVTFGRKLLFSGLKQVERNAEWLEQTTR